MSRCEAQGITVSKCEGFSVCMQPVQTQRHKLSWQTPGCWANLCMCGIPELHPTTPWGIAVERIQDMHTHVSKWKILYKGNQFSIAGLFLDLCIFQEYFPVDMITSALWFSPFYTRLVPKIIWALNSYFKVYKYRIALTIKLIQSNIQCPPLILAPLVNMSKGGCENKSALFILFIFHSKNSQNSNLSLK